MARHYRGQDDVAIGTPIAGRSCAETEGMVALFLNALSLCAALSRHGARRQRARFPRILDYNKHSDKRHRQNRYARETRQVSSAILPTTNMAAYMDVGISQF